MNLGEQRLKIDVEHQGKIGPGAGSARCGAKRANARKRELWEGESTGGEPGAMEEVPAAVHLAESQATEPEPSSSSM